MRVRVCYKQIIKTYRNNLKIYIYMNINSLECRITLA